MNKLDLAQFTYEELVTFLFDRLAPEATEHEPGEFSELDVNSRALLEAMFETLQRILELPDARTQKIASQGLGHLSSSRRGGIAIRSRLTR
jgi:hypothetical protein